jgi:hypothetical protein
MVNLPATARLPGLEAVGGSGFYRYLQRSLASRAETRYDGRYPELFALVERCEVAAATDNALTGN